MFKKDEFNRFVLDNNVVGIKEEPFKLKSGRLSHWYANCRVLSDTYGLLNRTAEFVTDYLKGRGIEFDYVYGVPAGATKLGIAVNYKLGAGRPEQKMIIGREKPKEHGDARDKYFIGPVEEGDKVVVLEDVTTTGGSVISQLEYLAEAKAEVVAVVALINRLERRDDGMSVAEYIKNTFGIDYHWLSDAKTLLPMAAKEADLSKGLMSKVQKNLNEHSVEQISVMQKAE